MSESLAIFSTFAYRVLKILNNRGFCEFESGLHYRDLTNFLLDAVI